MQLHLHIFFFTSLTTDVYYSDKLCAEQLSKKSVLS